MQFVNIHAAKTNLSKYLDNLDSPIVICKNGKPIAQLTAYQPPKGRTLGLLRGQITLSEDFNELPMVLKGYFE